LNFERTLFSAERLGPMKEALRYVICHAQRRIQFGKPTIDSEVNQFKIADMIAKFRIARLTVYHAAHLLDLAKLYIPQAYEQVSADAAQVMGGDGWTRFYPVENFLRDAKVNHIGAGTSEVMRMVIFRQGLRTMKHELKMPYRQMHPKLGVPISVTKPATTVDNSRDTMNIVIIRIGFACAVIILPTIASALVGSTLSPAYHKRTLDVKKPVTKDPIAMKRTFPKLGCPA